MIIRLIGAALVVAACGGFGLYLAREYRREEAVLQQLLCAFSYMEAELACRVTPLPELCMETAALTKGVVSQIFFQLSQNLQQQSQPDAGACLQDVLQQTGNLPASANKLFSQLGTTLGRFDYAGQMQELAAVKQSCSNELQRLTSQKEIRIRNYQTLGICAGVALAILLF